VLSYLLTLVSRDVLVQIAALPTAAEVWKHLETSFASQSRARAINTRMALATTLKGSSTTVEHFAKMKSLDDEMASARKKLDDKELTSYILAGLDAEYNSLVSSITARVEPITFGELYSQLLAYENRLDL
jgi:glutathionylspermidine synthase